MSTHDWPFVSVVVPLLNEAPHLLDCLTALAAQDYPPNRWEVLLVDGGSTDGTLDIIQNWAPRDARFRWVHNPQRIAATALNIGLREGRGDVIVRVDGHAVLQHDYLTRCVLALRRDPAVAAVGGGLRGIGANTLARSVAVAFASPLAAGDAAYRFPERTARREVDTVYLGAYARHWLAKVGGFNESLAANEDYELNWRLRRAGGRVVLEPDIVSHTWVRATWDALARQFFRYGFWKARMLRQHPRSLRWRQAVAPAWLASVVLLALAGLAWPLAWAAAAVIVALYLVATLTATASLCRRHGWQHVGRLPRIFWTMHLAWGAGFWAGMLMLARWLSSTRRRTTWLR